MPNFISDPTAVIIVPAGLDRALETITIKTHIIKMIKASTKVAEIKAIIANILVLSLPLTTFSLTDGSERETKATIFLSNFTYFKINKNNKPK